MIINEGAIPAETSDGLITIICNVSPPVAVADSITVPEGGTVEFNPSPDIIHDQITIYGSWVTSIGNLEDLVERMPRWDMHPDVTCTHKFPLDQAAEAYQLMDDGKCGKVAMVWED